MADCGATPLDSDGSTVSYPTTATTYGSTSSLTCNTAGGKIPVAGVAATLQCGVDTSVTPAVGKWFEQDGSGALTTTAAAVADHCACKSYYCICCKSKSNLTQVNNFKIQ